jgi:hypothetical protein
MGNRTARVLDRGIAMNNPSLGLALPPRRLSPLTPGMEAKKRPGTLFSRLWLSVVWQSRQTLSVAWFRPRAFLFHSSHDFAGRLVPLGAFAFSRQLRSLQNSPAKRTN